MSDTGCSEETGGQERVEDVSHALVGVSWVHPSYEPSTASVSIKKGRKIRPFYLQVHEGYFTSSANPIPEPPSMRTPKRPMLLASWPALAGLPS